MVMKLDTSPQSVRQLIQTDSYRRFEGLCAWLMFDRIGSNWVSPLFHLATTPKDAAVKPILDTRVSKVPFLTRANPRKNCPA